MRSKSSVMACFAKARKSSLAAHGLYVYGAWANKVPKLCSFIYALRLFISSTSRARMLPPRGLRVKYWNVLPPILVASFPICKYPFDIDKCEPIINIKFPFHSIFTQKPPASYTQGASVSDFLFLHILGIRLRM